LSLIGVSIKEGQKQGGVEQAPAHFRQAGLIGALESLGWKVEDKGDLTKEIYASSIESLKNSAKAKNYKY
jgi:arginase family enzyme